VRVANDLQPKGIVWAGLYSQDIERLARFYQDVVGLRLIEGDARCKIFDAGAGALFELWGRGTAHTRKTPAEQSVVIGFLVDDLEAAVAQLRLRGLPADTPIDSYLGTRWAYFTDPEGNRFELKDLRG
jgi:predicted enzyme related to lactoylglutathione lyase